MHMHANFVQVMHLHVSRGIPREAAENLKTVPSHDACGIAASLLECDRMTTLGAKIPPDFSAPTMAT